MRARCSEAKLECRITQRAMFGLLEARVPWVMLSRARCTAVWCLVVIVVMEMKTDTGDDMHVETATSGVANGFSELLVGACCF